MNASYVKNICRQLLQKSTPMEADLIFGGASCKRQCPGLLQCGRVAGIYSPEVCGLPTYGAEFWVMLIAIASLLILAGVGGWALGKWSQWARDRKPGKMRRVDAVMELDRIA
ncbi:hypothetical protein AAVH_08051 [Aphelenchoides avenae]|nr:hypothetical protein AAVH_08051 [Aphelenchus avenae]